MGTTLTRCRWSGLLTLLLVAGDTTLPGIAQEARRVTEPNPAYQVQYKRFTRDGQEKIVDEAWGREQAWLNRMGGELGPDFYRHYVREAEKERSRFPRLFAPTGVEVPALSGLPTWTSIGPTRSDFIKNGVTLHKVDAGRSRTILPHPTDPDTVYHLSTGGGLWKTTSFTSANPTWTACTDFVGSTMGGAVAFGKQPTTLYYGLGDSFERGVGGFMVKSTDGGATWSQALFLGSATRVHDLKVDTSGTQDLLLVATDVGLFRSIDSGATCTPVPGVTGAVRSIVRTSLGWLMATYKDTIGSLFYSTDQGATWQPITNGGNVFAGAGRTTLGVGQPGDPVVYAYAASTGNAGQLDLFRSADGGQSWSALKVMSKAPLQADGDVQDMNLMGNQAWFNHMLLVDPTDSTRNTVYLGGQLASAKTTDGGATWTILSDWLAQGTRPYVHADFHCAAFSQSGGIHRIYFGTDGGIFTSTDGGKTFDDTKNVGQVNHLIYALAVNPKLQGSALVGLQDNGTRVRVTAPMGTTYNQIRGGDGFGVGWAPASGYTLMTYTYGAIRRSTVNPPVDSGRSFVAGLPPQTKDNFSFVTPIATPTELADPTGKVFFTYDLKGGIYQCDDFGWKAISAQGTAGWPADRTVREVPFGLGIHPTDLKILAVAGNGGYVPMTFNGGTTWTEKFLGASGTDGLLPGWRGYNASVAWANNQILYVTSETTIKGAPHLARTTDGGATWTRADHGLPDLPVTRVVVDTKDTSGNTAYIATFLGVYRTTTGGTSWERFGLGLPQVRTTDIYLAPDSSYLRVSTWGRGVWELALSNNLPNPDLDGSGTLDVLDLLLFSRYHGGTSPLADLNGDGKVDDADLTLLLAQVR